MLYMYHILNSIFCICSEKYLRRIALPETSGLAHSVLNLENSVNVTPNPYSGDIHSNPLI